MEATLALAATLALLGAYCWRQHLAEQGRDVVIPLPWWARAALIAALIIAGALTVRQHDALVREEGRAQVRAEWAAKVAQARADADAKKLKERLADVQQTAQAQQTRLLALSVSVTACASNSPGTSLPPGVVTPPLAILPASARASQVQPPSMCWPTCSAGLTTLRANWRSTLTDSAPPAPNASSATTP